MRDLLIPAEPPASSEHRICLVSTTNMSGASARAPTRGHQFPVRGLAIVRPRQVCATDDTYIPMATGFLYLVAVIDWYSRKVLTWRLSNTLDAGFCVDALEKAIAVHGKPETFNTDQGSQFTPEAFTDVLKKHDIRISMDGKGRWIDNERRCASPKVERLWRSLKCEEVYLKAYETIAEARRSIAT